MVWSKLTHSVVTVGNDSKEQSIPAEPGSTGLSSQLLRRWAGKLRGKPRVDSFVRPCLEVKGSLGVWSAVGAGLACTGWQTQKNIPDLGSRCLLLREKAAAGSPVPLCVVVHLMLLGAFLWL